MGSFIGVLGQGLGIVAMILSVSSFQMKTKTQIIVMQILTSVVFATHYFMIGAIAGAVVNLIAIARNVVFFFNDTPFFRSRAWVWFFAFVMAASAIVSNMELISILMAIAMIFNTLAVSAKRPVDTRKMIVIASPFSFVYNVIVKSWGGMANEALVEIITIITLYRETKKMQKAECKMQN